MHSLILDKKDLNYCLLKDIFNIIDSRKSEEIFASMGFKQIIKLRTSIKIVFICMFFDLTTSFVVNELKAKKELREFFNISDVLEANQIYEYFSRNNAEQYLKAVNRILNVFNPSKRRGKSTYIVDATPADLDFNFNRKKQSKEKLEKLNLKWSYSSSKGYYIGFKATIVFNYDSTKPVAILIHSGAPNDAMLFEEILEQLRKRRVIKKGDLLIFDKGYYSYKNYQIGINKFKIIPFIFPRNNLDINRLDALLSYNLNIFKVKNKIKQNKRFFRKLKRELFKKLKNWKNYKPIRGKIEDYFKLLKQGLNMRQIHKYTPDSAAKTIILHVFLGSLITMQGYTTKTDLQKLSER